MARKLKKLLGEAYDRKKAFNNLHIRIDWDKSVFLIHPELKAELGDYYVRQTDTFALRERGGDLYLFDLRLVEDTAQFHMAPPELVVSLAPSRG